MGQSTPTTTKSKAPHKYIPFLVILPFLILPSIILFIFGETKWSLITLALYLPVLFILVMGMLVPRFQGQRLWEIYYHLTEDERRQWKKMDAKQVVFVITFVLCGDAIYLILYYILDVTHYAYYIIAYGVLFLIAIVPGLRARKTIIRFALNTKYAKENGWTTI